MTTQVEEIEVPEGHGLISTLDKSGDVRHMWDRNNADEVEAARNLFNDLTGDGGHIAYKAVGKKGRQGEVIRTFDPGAERIILVKQLVGG
jgi:hypothetical protein